MRPVPADRPAGADRRVAARPGQGAVTSAVAGAPVSVVNATGVILHTNLGRAAWPRGRDPRCRVGRARPLAPRDGRCDRRRGGRRFGLAEEHVVALTGAEAAIVATNNAAALAVIVGLAGRRGIAVSRGELVEIGGGVRIPEIIRRAGARLVEVGTTNRTRAADFVEPLASGRVAMVLRVHPSNFRMEGFDESPDAAEVAALAHAHDAIVVDDLGSGALLDTAAFGLAHEPTPAESLASGADLVAFSGDKLLGGPQAGIVAGRADLVARLRRDPLARATRPDKTILAALAATLGPLPRRPRDAGDPGLAGDRHAARRRSRTRAERIVARARIGREDGLSMVRTRRHDRRRLAAGRRRIPSWGGRRGPGRGRHHRRSPARRAARG